MLKISDVGKDHDRRPNEEEFQKLMQGCFAGKIMEDSKNYSGMYNME